CGLRRCREIGCGNIEYFVTTPGQFAFLDVFVVQKIDRILPVHKRDVEALPFVKIHTIRVWIIDLASSWKQDGDRSLAVYSRSTRKKDLLASCQKPHGATVLRIRTRIIGKSICRSIGTQVGSKTILRNVLGSMPGQGHHFVFASVLNFARAKTHHMTT